MNLLLKCDIAQRSSIDFYYSVMDLYPAIPCYSACRFYSLN